MPVDQNLSIHKMIQQQHWSQNPADYTKKTARFFVVHMFVWINIDRKYTDLSVLADSDGGAVRKKGNNIEQYWSQNMPNIASEYTNPSYDHGQSRI